MALGTETVPRQVPPSPPGRRGYGGVQVIRGGVVGEWEVVALSAGGQGQSRSPYGDWRWGARRGGPERGRTGTEPLFVRVVGWGCGDVVGKWEVVALSAGRTGTEPQSLHHRRRGTGPQSLHHGRTGTEP
jgi:hypothetical protein